MFDIRQVLSSYNVEWVDTGSNVKRGNINISCPFCGDDPSQHLGIHLETGRWGCWRNSSHKGRSLRRILKAVTPLTYEEIDSLIVDDRSVLDGDVFSSIVSGAFFSRKEVSEVKRLSMPKEFLKFGEAHSANRFWSYLAGRGINKDTTFSDRYGLRYCYTGKWQDRLIFPVYEEGELVTWTGRTILTGSVRYLSLTKEESVATVKEVLYNYDNATGGDLLFVVEGPFDCVKVDWFALPGVNSVAIMSANITESQVISLSTLSEKYRKVVVLLDAGYVGLANKLARDIAHIKNVSIGDLPLGVDDPGELDRRQVEFICRENAK